MSKVTTVHDASWALLRRLGVDRVFGIPGSTELAFLADFPDGINYVLTLQEASVVARADAYAQAAEIIDEALTYAQNEGLAPMTVAVPGVGQLTNPLVAGWSDGRDR